MGTNPLPFYLQNVRMGVKKRKIKRESVAIQGFYDFNTNWGIAKR